MPSLATPTLLMVPSILLTFLHSCGLDPKDDGAEAEYARWRKIEVEVYKFSVAIKSRRKEIIKKLPPNSRYDPADLLSDRWGSMSK